MTKEKLIFEKNAFSNFYLYCKKPYQIHSPIYKFQSSKIPKKDDVPYLLASYQYSICLPVAALLEGLNLWWNP